ncbi:hypothetical protein LOS78_03395 [Paracoccus sp. MA]|uniref:hypothetical protein n=1 Tax=Paracoccus sp. MA TaxID=2895796 RepID=UPI001E402839|nr:hypothetical protein [Paracoccus sp. MA]UFM64534.1 hypothetical protein LOS78_03395 [Paracoccus sp. MA]
MQEVVALLFGAAIVAVFSYERFNRVSFENSGQLERLVNLLSADHLRARQVVLQAYLIYAVSLLAIYFFLCAYAEVLPVLGGIPLDPGIGATDLPKALSQITGSDAAGLAMQQLGPAGETAIRNGISPQISLSVALIMVGVLPRFQLLNRVEDWMRHAAHRLAGIPTQVAVASEKLRQGNFRLPSPPAAPVRDQPADPSEDRPGGGLPSRRDRLGLGRYFGFRQPPPAEVTAATAPARDTAADRSKGGFLLPQEDWLRLGRYFAVSQARGLLPDPETFENDLRIIFACDAWLLERRLPVLRAHDREMFRRLEEDLKIRTGRLVLALDERVRLDEKAAQNGAAAREGEETDKPGNEIVAPGGWRALTRQTEELAEDFCTLLALYVEHDMLQFGHASSALGARGLQQAEAEQVLEEFLRPILSDNLPELRRQATQKALVWTFGIVVVACLLWAGTLNVYERELENWGKRGIQQISFYGRSFELLATSFNTYLIPLVVALAVRDTRRPRGTWHDLARSDWTDRLPQILLIAVLAWFVSTMFVIGTNSWIAALRNETGWTKGDLWVQLAAFKVDFDYQAPRALRGVVLALMVLWLMDDTRHRLEPQHSRLRFAWEWGIVGGLIMAATGGISRYFTALIALSYSTRTAIDSVDRGLIFYSVLFSGLIGLAVMFCLAAALVRRSPRPPQIAGTASAGSRTHPDREPHDA